MLTFKLMLQVLIMEINAENNEIISETNTQSHIILYKIIPHLKEMIALS